MLMECLALVGALLGAPAERELIRDPHFVRGFETYDPKPGKKVVVGRLPGLESGAAPMWGLAQWSSRFPLAGTAPQPARDGVLRYANEAKSVVLGRPGTPEADLALRVNAGVEYGGKARGRGEPWVHLLAEQTIEGSPTLAEARSFRFHLEARLRECRRREVAGYTPTLHAAQFLVYFTVQNLNRASAGFGDYYWFGIPVYDDRKPVVPRASHGDAGTGKLIYTTPGDAYAPASVHRGTWVTFDGDLLPEMLKGLDAAWERGFLKGSRDLSDYRVGGMNLGWEVPGPFDAEVQVCNLSLRAVLK